jgi:hypothetical protein
MGTHQGNPLGGALFVLAYFKALHSTSNYFPSYLFPSITNDTPCDIGLFIQPQKCVARSPFSMAPNFNTPS